jgi:hypothetical protein
VSSSAGVLNPSDDSGLAAVRRTGAPLLRWVEDACPGEGANGRMNDGTVIDRREVRFVDYVNRAAGLNAGAGAE